MGPPMAATYVKQIALYVTPAQHRALKHLSDSTRVAMQIYLREAVDDLLAKYKVRVPPGGHRSKS
jgi:hypothetical protein